jgi:hypothetical protein
MNINIKLFKLALLFNDLDYKQFGKLLNVTGQCVSQVANGKLKAPRVEFAILQYTKREIPELRKFFNSIILN